MTSVSSRGRENRSSERVKADYFTSAVGENTICRKRVTRFAEDLSHMGCLAVCLREAGRENVAGLLYVVHEERALDLDALRITLRGSE